MTEFSYKQKKEFALYMAKIKIDDCIDVIQELSNNIEEKKNLTNLEIKTAYLKSWLSTYKDIKNDHMNSVEITFNRFRELAARYFEDNLDV